jgi:SAM-dependent methyltransferase
MAPTRTGDWADYIVTEFVFAAYEPGTRVLDVGFGQGEQMQKLRAAGCRAVGVEYDGGLALRGASAGLSVCRARAESLPFATGSLDGLVCKVVIPYTDEARAIHEVARVLRPGGIARIAYHGFGYFLKYLLTDPDWKRRLYGARVILNTWMYRMNGRRLPAPWGDTLYQSRSRLRRYYRDAGLQIVSDPRAACVAGAPVFIYHVLRRTPLDAAHGEAHGPGTP